jgi:uncharacterized protein DUF2017
VSYFRSRRKGRVYVEMPVFSARLIADLARQLVELLSDGEPTGESTVDPLEELVVMDSPREQPTDPALLRLLPDAYPDDPEVAAEFRRFTEQGLRKAKIEAARVVIGSLADAESEGTGATRVSTPSEPRSEPGGEPGSVAQPDPAQIIDFELSAEQARAWMRCLTDLRLTLAARLDVTADDDEMVWLSLPQDDPRGSLYRIYGWLGFQLETLLEAVQR